MLANKLRAEGKKVVLVDCDVECPNDYLLLGVKLKKPVKKIYANFPKLDKEKCTKCGLCARKCRSNAVFVAPGKYPVFIEELCSGCGLCWHICPNKAIGIKKKLIGEVFANELSAISHQPSAWLITGRSVGVVDETGPIVTKLRDFAEKLARKVKADYLLFDTAVGLHCGVIRALIDCDLAYAVTEPTPLGSHDLGLILDLLKKLKVPAKVVLNQVDLGNENLIEKIVKKRNVKIAYKIPYSKKLVEAYSRGELASLNLL